MQGLYASFPLKLSTQDLDASSWYASSSTQVLYASVPSKFLDANSLRKFIQTWTVQVLCVSFAVQVSYVSFAMQLLYISVSSSMQFSLRKLCARVFIYSCSLHKLSMQFLSVSSLCKFSMQTSLASCRTQIFFASSLHKLARATQRKNPLQLLPQLRNYQAVSSLQIAAAAKKNSHRLTSVLVGIGNPRLSANISGF